MWVRDLVTVGEGLQDRNKSFFLLVRQLKRTPGALVEEKTAFDPEIGPSATQNPWVQSIWMFFADLFAGLVPVLPFAFLPLHSARTVCMVVTALLLLLLGVGRGVIGQKSLILTALQTLAIAAAAGLAGLLVSSLVNLWQGSI